MGIFDVEYNYDNIIRTTNSGLEISSFVQMKDAISKRYKEIYGNDIDIDSTTADGQFIMMMALMLFNGYSGLYYLSQNFDPASAQGAFLDRLCSFNNVFRKTASPSYAYLYVEYIGNSSSYTSEVDSNTTQEITCIDTSGNLWKWEEGKGSSSYATKFEKGKIYPLKFVCQENGPIEAEADDSIQNKGNKPVVLAYGNGYDENNSVLLSNDNHGAISKTLDLTIYPFNVWQAKDAVVGNDEETDVALRERRLMEIGNNGITVINGLVGSLLNVQGVLEAKVYSNNYQETESSNTFETKDGSKLQFHDVYVCVKYEENVEVDDEEIGKTIYNKLTPGVVTAPLNKWYDYSNHKYEIPNWDPTNQTGYNDFGEHKYYEVKVYQNVLNYKLYWKKCKPINPSMQLSFMVNNAVVDYTSTEEGNIKSVIKENFMEYINSLTIYDDLTIPNLLSYLNSCSPIISNQKAYIFTTGKVSKKVHTHPELYNDEINFSTAKITNLTSGVDDRFENCDTYFKYKDSNLNFDSETASANEIFTTHVLDIYGSL